MPIASITKLMTVLVALEHAKLDDVVTVSPRAAAVGESTIYLAAGERLTVRDLVEAALIQSANDAADALAEHVGAAASAAFVALMNAKAQKLGLTRHALREPDGLDAPGHDSSARDVTRLARIAMREPGRPRRSSRHDRRRSPAGARCTPGTTCSATFPGVIGVKTGHTASAGWSEVAAARGRGVTIYATILGGPTRDAAERRPRGAARLGARAVPRRAR